MAKSIQQVELLLTAETGALKSQLAGIQTQLRGMETASAKGLGAMGAGIKNMAVQFGVLAIATNAAKSSLDAYIGKESKLAEFSAITGVAGERLQEFGKAATELSNRFGTSTIGNIEAFKGVLSRLGPDFAKSSEAVKLMGENINILAKASGLDATQAMDSLTTAMLQFGVDLSDPLAAAEQAARMMDVMAAGAKEGAAEIPQITEALTQVGLTAKGLNISFTETNALIQTLAMGGKFGAEAGVGLRNVLTSLTTVTKKGAAELDDMGLKIGDISAALVSGGPNAANNALAMLRDGLAKLPNDAERATAMVKLFGKENLASAQALIQGIDATTKFTDRLRETGVAAEQAATIMETTGEKLTRLVTRLENAGEVLVGPIVEGWSALSDVFDGIGDAMDNLKSIFDGENFFRATDRAFKDLTNSLLSGLDSLTGGLLSFRETFGFEKTQKRLTPKGRGDITRNLMRGDAINPAAIVLPAVDAEVPRKGGGAPKKVKERDWLKEADAVIAHYQLQKANAEGLTIATLSLADATAQASIAALEWDAALGDVFSEENAARIDRMSDALLGISTTLGEGIGGAIVNGMQSLKDMLKSILVQMLDFVEKEYILAGAAAAIRALFTGGFSAFADASGWVAALVGLEAAKAAVGSFAVGALNVPRSGLANIHAGEMIVPATFAESVRRGEAVIGGNVGTGPSSSIRRQQEQRIHVSSTLTDTPFRSAAARRAYASNARAW